MSDMGLDFKAPPKSDVEHWEVVEYLYRQGFNYHSCGCDGPGYRPSRWAEVPAFLESHQCRPPGQVLVARFKALRKAGTRGRVTQTK